jgi:AcrR family transcriptional regulator
VKTPEGREGGVRRNAVANRERIVAAALEVFGTHGAAASTEEVARRAGVGIATVFRHFPTKDALVEEALLRQFAAVHELAAKAVRDSDPALALNELLRVMIGAGRSKLTLTGLLRDPANPPTAVLDAAAELRGLVDTVLRRAQEAGTADPDVSIDEVYFLLRGLAEASATGDTEPAVLGRAVRIIQRGVARGPTSEAPPFTA